MPRVCIAWRGVEPQRASQGAFLRSPSHPGNHALINSCGRVEAAEHKLEGVCKSDPCEAELLKMESGSRFARAGTSDEAEDVLVLSVDLCCEGHVEYVLFLFYPTRWQFSLKV